MKPAAIVGLAFAAGLAPASARAQPAFTLADAVRQGLATHPALASARAGVEAAAAGYREEGATRYPWLSLDASAIRFQEPMIVAPLHAFDPTRPPSFDATLIQSRLTGQFTLYDGGARAGRRAQAAARLGAAETHSVRAEADVIGGIVTTYLAALTGRAVHTAAGRRLTSLRAERNRIALFVEAGTAATVQLLRIDAALAQGEADSVRAARDLNTALRDLARQAGLASDTVSGAALSDLQTDATVGDSQDALVARAVASNPDRRAVEQQVAAARAAGRVARAARIPQLRLQAGYLTFGSAGGNFAGEWQAGVGVSYPLFSGGARAHRIARADAQTIAAHADLATLDLRIAAQVDRAIAQVAVAGAHVAALERAVAHLVEVTRIERLALEAGAGVQTDFLRAEADLFATRSALAGARQALVSGRVALARLTGELTETWIANELENVS